MNYSDIESASPILEAVLRPERKCTHCGADYCDWLLLDGEKRRGFLRTNLDHNICNLLVGRCPKCNRDYEIEAHE